MPWQDSHERAKRDFGRTPAEGGSGNNFSNNQGIQPPWLKIIGGCAVGFCLLALYGDYTEKCGSKISADGAFCYVQKTLLK
jgi:hypothetical protein